MSTENAITPTTGGEGAASTSAAVETPVSSTPSESAAPAYTPTPVAGGTADPAKAGAPVVTPNGQVAFVPNFKYKAATQDKELDPFFHSLVKDADSEKKVKDVFTRADAFDYIKGKYETRENEYKSLNNDYQALTQTVHRVNEAKAKGDLDSVFRTVGLNDHQIITWAAKRVDYLQMMNQLPPEQRQALQQQEQAAIQNQQYQDQMSQMQGELQEQKVLARTIRLDQALSRPEVSQAQMFWDQKMGREGAFKDQVVEEAQREWYMNKVDLPPEEAVSRVLKRFGAFISAQSMGSQDPMAPQGTPMAPQMPAARPVIPLVPGSSKTPIKKQVKSVADIKTRLKELEAQG